MAPLDLDYDLLTEPRPGYLFARARAVEVTPELAHGLLTGIKTVMIDARLGNVLLELELAHTMSDDEVLSLIKEMTRTLPGVRVAFVTSDSKHFASLQLVAASINSGEDHRSFSDTAAAKEWLLKYTTI